MGFGLFGSSPPPRAGQVAVAEATCDSRRNLQLVAIENAKARYHIRHQSLVDLVQFSDSILHSIMWKSIMSSEIAKSVQESLEKTGDSLTRHAQIIAKKPEPVERSGETEQQPEQLGDRLKKGWGSMLEATKQVVQEAREVVEKEQYRIVARLSDPDRPRRRDPSLPLDVEALRDAEVVYITDRIITLSHPAMQSTIDGSITPARKLAAIGHLFHKRHGGRYMVWNLSEVEYDLSILDDQVLLFSFPGSPSPPLGLLLKLLISMESWLKADERNVAVVHCLTGKGRTSTVVAAFLCWMGEAGFRDVHQALDYIAKCKRCPTNDLTIPSQRRYVQYFANMLDGVRPSQPPLVLKRIILSEAPRVSNFRRARDLAFLNPTVSQPCFVVCERTPTL